MNNISNKSFSVDDLMSLDHSTIVDFAELCLKGFFCCPSTKSTLNTKQLFNNYNYTFYNDSPVLFPKIISELFSENYDIPLDYHNDSILQYYLLSQIKGKSEINAPSDSLAANKHFYRMKKFCEDLSDGYLLDIGCDKPSVSHLFYPKTIRYHGIDPSFSNDEFKSIGMAEMLPFSDSVFDFVSFNTSLDHILDYYTAVEEAFRVLKAKGCLIIASYAWKAKATLLSDNVHFHYFRENQLVSLLINYFEIKKITRFEDPKGENHRYGVYIYAEKKS